MEQKSIAAVIYVSTRAVAVNAINAVTDSTIRLSIQTAAWAVIGSDISSAICGAVNDATTT